MLNFASKTERKISKDFERKGYIIQNVLDIKSLENIKKILVNSINKKCISYHDKNENIKFKKL